MKKLESTGYTWEEAPQNLKNAAVKLACGLNIAPVEAYKLLLEKNNRTRFKRCYSWR